MTIDPVEYLTGRWSVERTLAEGEEHGTYTGIAEFACDPSIGADPAIAARLWWDEAGRMVWRGGDLEARRRLQIVRAPGDEGWEVRFDDGRPFHPLELSDRTSSVVHPCGEDHYDGDYRVLDPDTFEVRWRVRGPRKDQRILSVYRRL